MGVAILNRRVREDLTVEQRLDNKYRSSQMVI